MMDWWRDRTRRRRDEKRARAAAIDAEARGIIERIAAPYLAAGKATVNEYPDGHLEVHPRAANAAAVWFEPGEHLHSLCVGPHGNLHEVLVGDDDGWKIELARCLEAVFEGRYVEVVSANGRRLTMHFEDPAAIVVKHFSGHRAIDYGTPGEHRYAPYE
jgi:hypothetical protein